MAATTHYLTFPIIGDGRDLRFEQTREGNKKIEEPLCLDAGVKVALVDQSCSYGLVAGDRQAMNLLAHLVDHGEPDLPAALALDRRT